MNKDELYMRRALDLAVNGAGAVSPNPMVGAVVVHEDKVLGEGWHREFGGPHAEVNALENVRDPSLLPESTIYVSLEPCSHYGKTPPCADLIIEKKLKRVVVGVYDPNPEVAGRGIKKLQDAGIEVVENVLEEACREINRRFFVANREKRPYVILKWAQTADGFIARKDYSSRWISCPESRSLVHKWRSEEDAILVGPNTALHDNPSLTVREWTGKNPVRVILDRNGRLPLDLGVFSDGHTTLYYSTTPDTGKRQCTHIRVGGEQFIQEVLTDLLDRGIMSIFVEGGAGIHEMLIRENLWDEARVFIGRQSFGDGISAPKLPYGKISRGRFRDDELIMIRKLWQNN